MKTYLSKLLVFIALVLGINIILSQIFITSVMAKSEIYRRDKFFNEHPDPVNILVMGNSRSRSAIDPQILEHSFNWSTPRENIIQTYYKLKYALEKHPRAAEIELVVLPLDISSFFNMLNHHDFSPLFYWRKYIDFAEFGAWEGESLKYRFNATRAWLFPTFGNGRYILDYFNWVFIRKGQTLTRPDGHTPHPERLTDLENRDVKVKDLIQTYFRTPDIYSPENVYWLEKCLQICAENNREVILFKAPLAAEYTDELNSYIPIDSTYSQILESLASYDNFLVFDGAEELQSTDLFYNFGHLNAQGATIFSGMLNDFVKQNHLLD